MSTLIASFQLPFSFADRLSLGDGEIRIPATFEEYLAFAEECEYRVEYSNNHIVSMGSPTDAHELIVMNFGWAMNNLIGEIDAFRIYGSNLGILIQDTNAHYKPDSVILNAEPNYVKHKVGKRTLKSILNPFAVIEVFSKGTASYDMTEKLPNYKQCPSLQYIIYIHQHKPFISVYTRSKEEENTWLNKDYIGLKTSFEFEHKKVSLENIYRKVIFLSKK